MKKSFHERINAIEFQHKNRQVAKPIEFFDENCGITLRLIGEGLAVPLPMDEKEWQEMMENKVINRRKLEVKES